MLIQGSLITDTITTVVSKNEVLTIEWEGTCVVPEIQPELDDQLFVPRRGGKNIFRRMSNPEWTWNLLQRSETVLDLVKRHSLETTSTLSDLVLGSKNNLKSTASVETSTGDSETDSVESGVELYESMTECLVSNFTEGFAIGGSVAVIINLLPAIAKGRFGSLHKQVITRGNIRVGVFFGMLMAVCNGLLHRKRSCGDLRSCSTQGKLRLIIGLLTGGCVSLLPLPIRRFLVYLLLTRYLEVQVRARRLPVGEEDVLSSGESVGLTMASMSVITTAWFGWPQLVPRGYLHFLDGISNIRKEQFRDFGMAVRGNSHQVEGLGEFLCNRSVCGIMHRESEPCGNFALRILLQGFITRTIPFYLKVYQFPLLFALLKNPSKFSPKIAAYHYIKRVLRSALFLASINGLVGASICTVGQMHRAAPSLVPAALALPLPGCISGLALYVENPSRRLELALYMFAQSLQILVNAYSATGMPTSRFMDIPVSALSISGLLCAHWDKEENGKFWMMRDSYSHLLGKIIDTKDKRHSFRLV